MTNSPIICFGQQPCGFFPKRYLYAKIQTARRLQREMGGEIVFFYHDSDHDPRETRTYLRHRKTGAAAMLNFEFVNKIQKKHSPLFLKRLPDGWQVKMLLSLHNYVEKPLIETFKKTTAGNAADFCLEMYRHMGLLEGVRVVRSGDPAFRRAACEIADYFVDVPYEGETVRARLEGDSLKLHEGGGLFVTLPLTAYTKEQISPTRDTRFAWMQSVVHCTHYVAGAGEQNYLSNQDMQSVNLVKRDVIERSDEAYTEHPG
ncbi:MAG TPA: hypothetical protein VE988_30690 [Gemmataceae bacterium]|nr:hypothetical protein [Gemmataceae bacterium]